jgi:hypothetical protein
VADSTDLGSSGGGDDWKEHRRLIYAELRRLSEGQSTLTKIVELIRIDVAKLQTKAALWGAGAGTVIGLLAAVVLKLIG